MSKSNWDKMAGWYGGMVGSGGHDYHKNYAIPMVLKLLELKPKEKILDIGCGPGSIAPHINAAGGIYYGVDASPKLIKLATKYHKNSGKFYIGDAARLYDIPEIKNLSFDKSVFMFSIQDMDPLEEIVKETARVTKAGGSVVLFLMHPAFRIPRQSGWGEDKKRKLIYRRVDRYISSNAIPLNTNRTYEGKEVTSYFYHRPLQRYFEVFEQYGLILEKFLEIAEDKKGYKEFPTFLALKLRISSK